MKSRVEILFDRYVKPDTRILRLTCCGLHFQDMEDMKRLLLESDKYAHLSGFWLDDNGIGNAGAIVLATFPANVQHLFLSRNSIGDQGLEALLENEWLRTLDLSGNWSLTEKAAELILTMPHRLTTINLNQTNIALNPELMSKIKERVIKNQERLKSQESSEQEKVESKASSCGASMFHHCADKETQNGNGQSVDKNSRLKDGNNKM